MTDEVRKCKKLRIGKAKHFYNLDGQREQAAFKQNKLKKTSGEGESSVNESKESTSGHGVQACI